MRSGLQNYRVSPYGTWVLYVVTLGLWEIWRRSKSLILTNQRVVLTHRMLTTSQRSIPLEHIQDATAVPMERLQGNSRTLVRSHRRGSVHLSTTAGVAGIGSASGIGNFGPANLQQSLDFAQQVPSLSSHHRGGGRAGSQPTSTAE